MLIFTEKVLIFSLRNFNEIFRENVNYDNIKSPKNTRVSPSTQNMHFQKSNRKRGQIDLSPAFLELRIEQALYMKRLHISRLYVTLPSDILKNISVFKTNCITFAGTIILKDCKYILSATILNRYQFQVQKIQ